MSPWQTHKAYGQRATSETWIEESKNQMTLAHIKMDDFWGSSALFQCSILAYNTVRWMALCSGDKALRRWEPATIRTFLIRVAGRIQTGSRQLGLNTPASHLYKTQWDAWVDVGLNRQTDRQKNTKNGTKGLARPFYEICAKNRLIWQRREKS